MVKAEDLIETWMVAGGTVKAYQRRNFQLVAGRDELWMAPMKLELLPDFGHSHL